MVVNNAINVETQGTIYFNGNTFNEIDASTTGFILTSNGTGIAPSFQPNSAGALQQVTISLTNAQIKALHTTPVTILAAQGSGVVIIPIAINIKLVYGGTNAFSAAGSTLLNFGSSNFESVSSTTVWEPTQSHYVLELSAGSQSINASSAENAAITISASSAITGNAANNNTGKVNMLYYTISI